MEPTERAQLGTIFDRTLRNLRGIPDAVGVKAATVRAFSPVAELAQTFVIESYRHREQGDYIFVEYIGTEGSFRVCLPPAVADCINRQRDALTAINRKRGAREAMAKRKASGWVPTFGPRKGGRKAKGKGRGKGEG